MEKIATTDERGRKIWAFKNGESEIPIGPDPEVVDSLNLPEPFATRLHNILFDRGILTYADASKAQNNLIGILQEALMIDVQALLTAFYNSERSQTEVTQ